MYEVKDHCDFNSDANLSVSFVILLLTAAVKQQACCLGNKAYYYYLDKVASDVNLTSTLFLRS